MYQNIFLTHFKYYQKVMNPVLKKILDSEIKRQQSTLDLIPSENFSSSAVRSAVGSVFMHKYSEGYPNARYYEGNENIDALESLCIKMAQKVFKLPKGWSANVQPLAGSNANLAVYNGLLNIGDKILSMYLPDGGHLSHGWSYGSKEENENVDKNEMVYRGGSRKVNIVSKLYNVVQYKTQKDTNLFDYDFIEKLALKEKPQMIITGGTAYPRNIDYKRMRKIADKVGAIYLADIAHEAGLIAAGVLPSPVGIADVVTMTTHKTLRGPKGAMILMREEYIEKINKSIIPGMQGGAHNGTIAGILQALFEADTKEFKEYSKQVLKNAQILADTLMKNGFKVVSDGTDKHLVLIDLRNKAIGGKYASRALSYANIITNMNTVPYETGSPLNPSGLRIGSPTLTTRGMKEAQLKQVSMWITEVIEVAVEVYKAHKDFEEFEKAVRENSNVLAIKKEVMNLCSRFPLDV